MTDYGNVDTDPVNPQPGDRWYNTVTKLFHFVRLTNSYSNSIPHGSGAPSGTPAGLPLYLDDDTNTTYGWVNDAWVAVGSSTPSTPSVGSAYGDLLLSMSGLLCYFPLQETGAGDVADYGPNSYVGRWSVPAGVSYTATGGPVTAAPRFNVLAGTTSLFVSKYPPLWNGQYTFVAFLKTGATGNQIVLGNRSTSGAGVALGMGGHGGGAPSGAGKMYGIVDDGGTAKGRSASATSNDNAWHLYAWTWSGDPGVAATGTDFHAYVDGVEASAYGDTNVGSGTHPVVGASNVGLRLLSGNQDGAQSLPFAGSACHLAVFLRALTAAEILALYNARDD